jgi:hypothetical protein
MSPPDSLTSRAAHAGGTRASIHRPGSIRADSIVWTESRLSEGLADERHRHDISQLAPVTSMW